MSDKKIHRYFLSRESSKWDIVDFLEESSEEPFEKKIDVYIKSLNNLANYKRGKQRERALTLIDKYKEARTSSVARKLLVSSPFKTFC
ncbi:hypothetical protein RirG_151840 [Rhizophagus irregularis DAOM 197198w]|uniref:Uncharacterized protein n=1 Tax=Rhizophagus irregularis (strain DAOM 197198w) TaxID=1432141 RepID=A0A015KU67_RHIIW|nr:hypothetical protein RirG_151840 [Rhizophagus irregularis DAOM 197198w]